jgi:hypothetical protein
MSEYPQNITKMKYNKKNIALVWLVAIFSALMATSCSTARTAADEYRQYLSERPDVAEKLDLESETSVIIPEAIEDSLSATAEDISSEVGESILSKSERKKLTNAEEIIVDATENGADIEIKIDARGTKSEARKLSFLEGKYDRLWDPVYASKGKTKVDLGKESDLFTQRGKTFWYDAPKKELHQLEHVGDHVVAEYKLTGFNIAPWGGGLYYGNRWNLFAGGKIGYNTKACKAYIGVAYADATKNGDDINAGGKYGSWYIEAGIGYRFDLTPKGKLWDKFTIAPIASIGFYTRQLEMKEDLEIQVPEGVNYEFNYDDTDFIRGTVIMPQIGLDAKLRLSKVVSLEASYRFAPWTHEYRKVHSTAANGQTAHTVSLSLVIFPFNGGWKKVAPSLGGIVKRANSAAKKAQLQRTLDAY